MPEGGAVVLRRGIDAVEGLPALAAGLAYVGFYLVLRNPDAREWLLDLAGHRPMLGDWGRARQWMAPRSCFFAGALAIVAGAGRVAWAVWMGRTAAETGGAARGRGRSPLLLSTVAWLQALAVLAVGMNLVAAHARMHQPWPWRISPDSVLRVVIGPALHKSAALRDSPQSTGCYIAQPTAGPAGGDERIVVHSLVYPAALYPAPEPWWPETLQNERWNRFFSSQWRNRMQAAPIGVDVIPSEISYAMFPGFIVVPCP